MTFFKSFLSLEAKHDKVYNIQLSGMNFNVSKQLVELVLEVSIRKGTILGDLTS